MAKQIQGYIKLEIAAGKANPSPPVGPALGQQGVNIMEFCKAFNAATQQDEPGAPIPVVITVYQDKSFSFIKKKPPVSYFIKKKINLKKGSNNPGKDVAGTISWDALKEIAEQKMEDLNAHNVDAAARMIAGSARSMGLEVTGMDEAA